MVPGGIRMGSPALTSRGFIESDFEQVAEFVHRGIQIAKTLKGKAGALCSSSGILWCSMAFVVLLRVSGSCPGKYLYRIQYMASTARRCVHVALGCSSGLFNELL